MAEKKLSKKEEREQLKHLRLEQAKREVQLERELELNERRIKTQGKLVETLKDEGEATLKSLKAQQRQQELSIKRLDLLEKQRDLTDEEIEEMARLEMQLEKTDEKVKGLTKSHSDLRGEFAEGARISKNYGQALFGLSGEFSNLYTKFIPKTAGEFMNLAGSMLKGIATGKVFKSLALKIINETFNLAFAQDKAASAFRQATGAGKEFNTTLFDIERAGAGAGVTMQEAGKATLSLFNTYRDFTNLSEAEQTNVGTTVALMNELGVATDTSAKIMDQATKSLGMSTNQSEELLRTLASTAKQIGKPMSEVAADFASVAPKLAFYGQDMIGVFQKLEMQAKATGLSVDQILGVVGEGFDTFEGAGKKVGQLNAILGGPYLNSIDMLNASEEERLELIKQSIESSGVVFNNLNKFEQKAFAAALGTDVDTLRRSMGALTVEEEIQAMEQEKLAALASDTKDVMEELRNAFRTLIVENRELFKSFSSLVSKFSEWLKGLDKGKIKFWAMTALWVAGTVKVLQLVIGISKLYKAMQTLKIIGGITKLWAGAVKVMKLWRAGWILTNTTMAATPIGAILVAVGIAMALLMQHFFNMKEAGLETGAIFADMAKKVMMLTGPLWMLVSVIWSVVDAFKEGGTAGEIFHNAMIEIMNNLSFGLFGWMMNKIAPGKALGTRGGDWSNIERAKVKDAVITNKGEIIEVDPADNIVAAQPGGALSKAMGGLGVGGAISSMAIRQIIGPILKEAITDPVVRALTGTADGAQPNINVIVKIGEKELNEQIITALNSPAGAAAISPFYQG